MESQIRGKVWKFGDDINTDIISPGEYMDASYEEIGKHAMERAYPGFSDAIEKGDIIVAGENFGPGSSRDGPDCIAVCRGGRRHCQELCQNIFPQLHQCGISRSNIFRDRKIESGR